MFWEKTLPAGLGLAVVLFLAGCGGSGSADDAATPAGGGRPTVNTDQLVKFAQCMRENGVDLPDPKPGQSILDWLDAEQREKLMNSGATAKCRDELPEGIRKQQDDPDRQNRLLELARCMRDNGVNMPDPKNGKLDFGAIDRDSPGFQDAFDKCSGHLTGGGGR